MWNGFYKVSESNSSRRGIMLYCVDATDGITPETGEAGGQPQLSKQGAAWSNTAATLTAIGNGWYYVVLTAAELDTPGRLMVRYKSANTAESLANANVVSFDPFNAASLGLSNLDNTISSRATDSGAATAVWAAGTRTLSAFGFTPNANVAQIDGDTAAATNLKRSAGAILYGTVDSTGFTPTTTAFEAAVFTAAASTHYKSRAILFLTGTLAGQVVEITAYAKTGANGKVTTSTMTSAPANGDTFIVL